MHEVFFFCHVNKGRRIIPVLTVGGKKSSGCWYQVWNGLLYFLLLHFVKPTFTENLA